MPTPADRCWPIIAASSTPTSVEENSVTMVRLSEDSGILECHWQSTQPWDWRAVPIQRRGAEDRVVGAFVKSNHDPVGLDFHDPSSRYESLVRLLRLRFVIAGQPRCQPAVAPMRDHRQRQIPVHIEADFAGQAVD